MNPFKTTTKKNEGCLNVCINMGKKVVMKKDVKNVSYAKGPKGISLTVEEHTISLDNKASDKTIKVLNKWIAGNDASLDISKEEIR